MKTIAFFLLLSIIAGCRFSKPQTEPFEIDISEIKTVADIDYVPLDTTSNFCAAPQEIQPILFLEKIKTLEEAIKPFHGKIIYIDIWATWCKPCIMEFAHNETLKEILNEKDVQQLYISLDNDFNDKNWKDIIKQYNLTGTHIRANREFSAEIVKLFFTNGFNIEISIPRYILIDEKGNVMNDRAKRPSQLVAGEKLW